MSLLEMMYNRRSVRKYTGEPVSEDDVKKVVSAGLLGATGKNIKPWEFIVVNDKDVLQKLADCRTGSVAMLKSCEAAIVVIADENKTDVWVEDCSVAMANMHLMADSLGLGSCWVQARLREANDGRTAEDFVKDALTIPANYKVEAILTLGQPEGNLQHTQKMIYYLRKFITTNSKSVRTNGVQFALRFCCLKCNLIL